MSPPADTQGIARRVALGLAVIVGTSTTAVLAIWLGGETWTLELVDPMNANTALALSCCAAALAARALRPGRVVAADLFALLPLVIGELTLLEYLGGVDLGIDALFQAENTVMGSSRMAPNTALALTAAGLSLIFIARGRRVAIAGQVCAVVTFAIGFTAAVGYLYDATMLYQPTQNIRMAGLTAAAMMLLGLGVLTVRTDLGLPRLFTARHSGGYVLRRALPVVVAVPVLFGTLRLALHDLRAVDVSTGTALLVVAMIAVCATLAVLLARSIATAEALRRTNELSLEAQAVERAQLLDSERGLRAAAERTATELRAAQREAVAANQTKDEFLAMLGHELRNPLAPIAIALDMLERRREPALLRERSIIQRQVKHLMRMVDDLLDVSRIARGKVELNRAQLELRVVVDQAVEMAAPLFEEKRHHLRIEVPVSGLPLYADARRLTQVVSNLLTNAARYTEDGGHVTVRARRLEQRVQLTVEDDGSGIDPAQLPHVFEAFVQAPIAQRTAAGGLGLGLALVRRFTELHGGTVSAKSDGLGRGASFAVELPLSLEAHTPAASSSEPARASPARRVLVVDDNVDAAEMLAEGLRDAGHHVQVANDGPQALDVAARVHPDVAFLDLGLPAMDGYEVAVRLRELDQHVVLVAVTGYGQPSDRARTRAAGFQHHLVKPVDLETTLDITRDVSPS